MKITLFWGAASPFVRKVMVAAHELGVEEILEILNTAAHPIDRDLRVQAFNPLAKVPAARVMDGSSLYDSRVICEYLDEVSAGGLFPPVGPARWTALRRQALADALLDAALLMRYERLIRPDQFQWPLWVERQREKVDDALDAMQADCPDDDCADIGAITFACALAWLDLRFPEIDWRATRPDLQGWFTVFEMRPAMRATRPRNRPDIPPR